MDLFLVLSGDKVGETLHFLPLSERGKERKMPCPRKNTKYIREKLETYKMLYILEKRSAKTQEKIYELHKKERKTLANFTME